MKLSAFAPNRKVLIAVDVLLIAVVAVSLVITQGKSSADTPKDTATVAAITPAAFSFDAAKATGWRQGPANATSMTLFKQGSDCFTSVKLENGTVDEVQALAKITTNLSADGYTVTATDTLDTQLAAKDTPSPLAYTLHHYAVSGTGKAGQVYKSQARGYISLEHKYVQVEAYCADDTSLAQIHDALSAITLTTKQ